MLNQCKDLEIISNKKIAKDTFELVLSCDTTNFEQGQFVNLKVEGFYLRRPFSVAKIEKDLIYIIYKIYGDGTNKLSKLTKGFINCLYFLGNGFEIKEDAYFFGASVGIAPLVGLSEQINNKKMYFAFANKEYDYTDIYFEDHNVFYDSELNLIEYLKQNPISDVKNFYCCGSKPFMKEIHNLYPTGGQFLYEAHMGCGYGACMSCSIGITEFDTLRTCLDGPKFSSEELDYEFANEV